MTAFDPRITHAANRGVVVWLDEFGHRHPGRLMHWPSPRSPGTRAKIVTQSGAHLMVPVERVVEFVAAAQVAS